VVENISARLTNIVVGEYAWLEFAAQ